MEYELGIRGMHCRGCARSLERYLGSEPGVESASVDYEDQRGTITVDADVDVAPLVEGIERMGYEVEFADGP